jgi:hypothetical protein
VERKCIPRRYKRRASRDDLPGDSGLADLGVHKSTRMVTEVETAMSISVSTRSTP